MASSTGIVTVYSFSSPHELAIVVGRLESEGIECFVQDELTIQANPLYSNALGGIKLQVKEHDVERTVEILKESGYNPEQSEESSRLIIWLDKQSERIPLLSKLRVEYRILTLLAFTLIISSYLIYLITKPFAIDRLSGKSWCLDYVIYDNKTYIPSTNQAAIRLSVYGQCAEIISFGKSAQLSLPGFNSREVKAKWAPQDEHLHIVKADSFDFIYNGIYEIDFTKTNLILKSDKTTLVCSSNE